MKKPETVTDDEGNIYIITGQMTREEAEVYFPDQPERSKREDLYDVHGICNNCKKNFDPQDWQSDICDKCLYKR